MTNRISIIIPVYNGMRVIARCLNSIYASKIGIPFEVIVIDDGSTDDTAKIAQQFPCLYFKIKKSGVAAARNIGIEKAKGDILFFFDADVKLKDDTIQMFLRHFQEDKDAYIIQGRWDQESNSPAFFSRFLLLKYTYNLMALCKGKNRIEAANLETGCLAIKAEVFNHFKGFDERYRYSGGEEHELGMRLLEKYKIYYYPDILVEHAFGSILSTLGKIYRRTVNFAMLSFIAKNKNFMKMHENSVPKQDKISVIIIFLLFASCLLFPFNAKFAFCAWGLLLFIYLLNISSFLRFLIAEENIIFAMSGAVSDFVIMFPRLFGLLKAMYAFHILRQGEFKL